MDSVGEGEGGKIWENGIETCKISCMKKINYTSKNNNNNNKNLPHLQFLNALNQVFLTPGSFNKVYYCTGHLHLSEIQATIL